MKEIILGVIGVLAGIIGIIYFIYRIYYQGQSIGGVLENDDQKINENLDKSVNWVPWLMLLAILILCLLYRLYE